MKLTGDLKKKVEKAKTREAARETIAQAGMLLNDEELDQVSGGRSAGGGEPQYKFQVGQTVRIVYGIYNECTGVVEKITKNQQAINYAVRLTSGQVIEFTANFLSAG